VQETRFYVVTPRDIVGLTNTADRGRITVPYRKHPVGQDNPVAQEIDGILSAVWPNPTDQPPSVDQVWVMSKGFGGVYPLKNSIGDTDFKLRVGPQFSHEVGRDRTLGGKILQVLLVPAVAFDVVTSPIQFFYFAGRLDEAWQ
jgi:hypothetical protein